MGESYELGTEECVQLLHAGVIGRVAISTPDGPHVVPVNYSVVDDRIIFRTTPYSVVGTYGTNTQMAFEVDHVDYEYWTGSSILARGRGEAVSDPAEVQRIKETWPPHPWASGQRNLYIAIRWSELTGRRLGPVVDAIRDRPVDRKSAGR
ncbi:MAG: pyridoxamine 5'-phosphate oxidase family protein [Propionibacteriales bacterium]|nr:pyridoxamine 5'-phosphate oxidase family protein [Propionibacteriales bacterium]